MRKVFLVFEDRAFIDNHMLEHDIFQERFNLWSWVATKKVYYLNAQALEI